jgi:hypothetical protein
MGRTSWFDEESNELEFAKYVEQMESWQAALADGIVTPEEVYQQTVRVAGLLQALEAKLSDEIHAELTTIFYELAALYGMERIAQAQLDEEA